MRLLEMLRHRIRKGKLNTSPISAAAPPKKRFGQYRLQWFAVLIGKPRRYLKSKPWQSATALLCLILFTLLIILNVQGKKAPAQASDKDPSDIPVLSVESRIPGLVSTAEFSHRERDQGPNNRDHLLPTPKNENSSEIRPVAYERDSAAAFGSANVRGPAAWLTGTIEEAD